MSKQFTERLRSGQPVYGTLIVAESPRWVDVVAQLGLDFIFIDTEHVALDRRSVAWMCQVYAGVGLTPLVRLPSPDPYEACMALDGGAQGVIAPYVETPEQARALKGAVKLRPLKGKRLAETLADPSTLEPALADYMEEGAKSNALILNIESVPGMEALDEILAVGSIDAVLIGPHDLSCSLGLAEQYDHPKFDEAVCRIVRIARERGLGVGIHNISGTRGLDRMRRWMKEGLNFVLHSADIIAMSQQLAADLAILRDNNNPTENKTHDINI